MIRFRRATAIAAVFALAAALAVASDVPAFAKNDKAAGSQGQAVVKGKPDHAGKGKSGKSKGGKPDHAGKGKRNDDAEIGDFRERRPQYRDEDVVEELRRYRRDRGDRTPDYLRNTQGLPPGIAKNLERGKPLPPGIAKKVGDDDLLRRLPRTYDRSEWYTAGDRMVEYDPVNEAIINVVEGALYGN